MTNWLKKAQEEMSDLNWESTGQAYGDDEAWTADITIEQAKQLENAFHLKSPYPDIKTVDDLAEYGYDDFGLETGSPGNYTSIFVNGEGGWYVIVSGDAAKKAVEKAIGN